MVRNYEAHAKESGGETPEEPTYFLKPSTSIIHDGDSVIVPPTTSDLQVEAELGVVMDETKRVSAADAYDHVLGYCVLLDITARDLQRQATERGLPWTLSKGMDTFAPVSRMAPRDEVGDPHALEILLRVNGEVRQTADTAQMIHRIPAIVAYVSGHMTLMKGDLIATGTPAGVPRVEPGDAVEAEISRVGRIRVAIVGAS